MIKAGVDAGVDGASSGIHTSGASVGSSVDDVVAVGSGGSTNSHASPNAPLITGVGSSGKEDTKVLSSLGVDAVSGDSRGASTKGVDHSSVSIGLESSIKGGTNPAVVGDSSSRSSTSGGIAATLKGDIVPSLQPSRIPLVDANSAVNLGYNVSNSRHS